MTAIAVKNLGRPKLKRDKESHRTYTVDWLVETDDVTDGPINILAATGLPQPGDYYEFYGEYDHWATCKWDMDVQLMHQDQGRGSTAWKVTQRFSTKSDGKERQQQRDNPLNEPPEISGGWNQVARKRHFDKDNKAITNSSKEPITSDDVLTRNIAQPTVDITMNLPDLPLSIIATAINRVNQTAMWGLGPRHVRLYNCPWSRKIMTNGFMYYSVTYQFECSFESWDIPFLDQGFKEYVGPEERTEKQVANPLNYSMPEGVDQDEEPFLLNGEGGRLADGEDVVFIKPQIDSEFNFFALGIPTRL